MASVRPLVLFGLVVLAASMPWLLKNWVLLQAPIHPFLTGTSLEPWLDTLYLDQDTVPVVNPDGITYQVPGAPNLLALLTSPDRFTVEGEGLNYFLNPLFLFLPLWLLFLRATTLNWLVVPGAIYVMGLVAPFGFANVRYLLPALAPLTIAAVYVTGKTLARLLPAERAAKIFALLTILVLLPTGGTIYRWYSGTKTLSYLVGTTSREEYMANAWLFSSEVGYARVTSFMNRNLPRESRILMLFEARGFYFDAHTIQDNRLINWSHFGRRAVSHGCGVLRTADISHVLLNQGALAYYVSQGMVRPGPWLSTFSPFAERCLVPIYGLDGFILYGVNQPATTGLSENRRRGVVAASMVTNPPGERR